MPEPKDKYHTLLNYVESLEFDNGDYVKICNALMKCKDEIEAELIATHKLWNTEMVFTIHNTVYTYKFKEYMVFRGLVSNKFKYSISKRRDTDTEIITQHCDTVNDTHHILFSMITYSKDIHLKYYDGNGDNYLTHTFKNFGALKRFYHKKDKEECDICGDEDEDNEDCELEHSNFGHHYYLVSMLNADVL